MLIFDLCPETPSSTQQVGHVHSALSQCLEMLECLIAREVEELGEEIEGEYETARNTVKDRLGHLLHSTGALLENGEGVCTPLPEFQCIQVGKERQTEIFPFMLHKHVWPTVHKCTHVSQKRSVLHISQQKHTQWQEQLKINYVQCANQIANKPKGSICLPRLAYYKNDKIMKYIQTNNIQMVKKILPKMLTRINKIKQRIE